MAIQVSTIQVRGKLGNAVGYKRSGARRSGANFARVYTDVVRDPQTASQLYQRAIAATVAKAYAAMSRICDHSFQGSAVGAESMQRFYSVNLNQLRRDVMRDLSDPVTDPVDMVASVVAPRSAFATCYSYIVSEGTLTNSFLRVSSIDAQICVLFPAALNAEETVSAYVRRCGLVRGDIFTALGLGVLDPQGAFASQYGQLASQPSVSFGFIRFKLKDAAFSDNSPVSEAPVSQVFSVEYGGQATAFADDELPERAVFCDSITGGDDGFLGVIRSRRNSPLRSSCRLAGTLTDGTVSEESKYGIKSAYLLNAWLPEQDTLGQSSLILEGGSLNGNHIPRPAPEQLSIVSMSPSVVGADEGFSVTFNRTPYVDELANIQFLTESQSGWSWLNASIDESAEGKDRIAWTSKLYNASMQEWQTDVNIYIEDAIDSPTVYFMNVNGSVNDIRVKKGVSRSELVDIWYPMPSWLDQVEQMPVGELAAIYNGYYLLFTKDSSNIVHCSLLQCEQPIVGHVHKFATEVGEDVTIGTIDEVTGLGSCIEDDAPLEDIFDYPRTATTFQFDTEHVGSLDHMPVQPSFAFEI